jgi:hypothetical protein
VPYRAAALRTLLAAGLGVVAVCVVSLPFLLATFGPESGAEEGTSPFLAEQRRSNDLLGFLWVGGPEGVIVSWPAMLGYSTLVLCALGFQRVRRQGFWIAVGLFFLVLSLGAELEIGTKPSGIPLPYRWLERVPVLSFLRKPDRCFVMVQLCVALCLAAAWPALAERFRRGGARALAWAACALVPLAELSPAPFERFDYRPAEWFETLARDGSVTAILDVPISLQDPGNARYLYDQTVHGKKIALGYTTALAATPEHEERRRFLTQLYADFVRQDTRALVRFAQKQGFDLLVQHKTEVVDRPPDRSVQGAVLWKPFALLRRALMGIRLRGQYAERPYTEKELDELRALYARNFGPAVHEDERLLVYRVPRSD